MSPTKAFLWFWGQTKAVPTSESEVKEMNLPDDDAEAITALDVGEEHSMSQGSLAIRIVRTA